MTTTPEDLKKRSRQFALEIIFLVRRFPRTLDAEIVGRQLIRAATSTAANYRSACRSRSPNDFISRISVVSEEADEAELWLDITVASGIVTGPEALRLHAESNELSAIFTASRNTAKRNHRSAGAVLLTLLAILAFLAMLAMLAILAILVMQPVVRTDDRVVLRSSAEGGDVIGPADE